MEARVGRSARRCLGRIRLAAVVEGRDRSHVGAHVAKKRYLVRRGVQRGGVGFDLVCLTCTSTLSPRHFHLAHLHFHLAAPAVADIRCAKAPGGAVTQRAQTHGVRRHAPVSAPKRGCGLMIASFRYAERENGPPGGKAGLVKQPTPRRGYATRETGATSWPQAAAMRRRLQWCTALHVTAGCLG